MLRYVLLPVSTSSDSGSAPGGCHMCQSTTSSLSWRLIIDHLFDGLGYASIKLRDGVVLLVSDADLELHLETFLHFPYGTRRSSTKIAYAGLDGKHRERKNNLWQNFNDFKTSCRFFSSTFTILQWWFLAFVSCLISVCRESCSSFPADRKICRFHVVARAPSGLSDTQVVCEDCLCWLGYYRLYCTCMVETPALCTEQES